MVSFALSYNFGPYGVPFKKIAFGTFGPKSSSKLSNHERKGLKLFRVKGPP